jgi:hypothetical protein
MTSNDEMFDRAWILSAGPKGKEGQQWGHPFADQEEPPQIKFSVELTRSKYANKASIQLNNLSDQSIGLLQQPNTTVRLSAGYASRQLLAVIFNGQIAKRGVKTKRIADGTYETTIEAGEAEISLQDTWLAISLGPGTDNRGALFRIAGALGVTLYGKDQIPLKTFSTGWVYDGKAGGALDELADSVGADWSIQGNELQILKPGEARQDVVFIVSPESGLIGIPEKVKDGISLTSYLLPALRPNRTIQIESSTATGLYIIDSLTHEGDWKRGPWVSKIKARPRA